MKPAALAALLLVVAACAGSDAAPAPSGPQTGFVDVATDVGLDFRHGAFHWGVSADPAAMMGGGVCWLDADDDGWLDLFLVNTYSLDEWSKWDDTDGVPTAALYRNDAGTFTDVSADAGVDVPLRGLGCVAADLDGDGHTDLYVTTEREDALFWNDGDGTFTHEATGAFGWNAGAAAGDLDGDGDLDVIVTGYADTNNRKPGSASGFPGSYLGRRDLLFENLGGRELAEVGEAAGLDAGGEYEYGLGVVLADLDGDADLDAYVANDTNPNRIYENRGALRFAEVSGFGAAGDDRSGMGVAPGDANADGQPDLVVTNLAGQGHSYYIGGAGLALTPAGTEVGDDTGWGTTWADFDHDTHLDLLVVHGAVPIADLAADARPVSLLAGPDLAPMAAELRVGRLNARGSAAADYDNDGDLDVAVNQVGGRVALLENRQAAGNWLLVAGLPPGSTVAATLPDGRVLHRTVHAGSSYLSSEDSRVHLGLGDADEVSQLRVTWTDGRTRTWEAIGANQVIDV